MLSFSEFLLEVARDRTKAQKLLNYVAKRQGAYTHPFSDTKQVRSDTQIKTILPHIQTILPHVWSTGLPNFVHPQSGISVDSYIHAIEEGKVKKVPVKNIITTQDYVQKEIVAKKIQRKWKEHYPEHPHGVIVHAPGHVLHGKIILTDGNHRAVSAKLQGKEKLAMKVATVHIDPEDLELYHQMKEIKK